MIYRVNYARLKNSVPQANITQCKNSIMQYFGTEGNFQEEIRIYIFNDIYFNLYHRAFETTLSICYFRFSNRIFI